MGCSCVGVLQIQLFVTTCQEDKTHILSSVKSYWPYCFVDHSNREKLKDGGRGDCRHSSKAARIWQLARVLGELAEWSWYGHRGWSEVETRWVLIVPLFGALSSDCFRGITLWKENLWDWNPARSEFTFDKSSRNSVTGYFYEGLMQSISWCYVLCSSSL